MVTVYQANTDNALYKSEATGVFEDDTQHMSVLNVEDESDDDASDSEDNEMGMDVVDYIADYDEIADDPRAQPAEATRLSATAVLLARIAQGQMKVPEVKQQLKNIGEVQHKVNEKAADKLKRLEEALQQRLRAERERAERVSGEDSAEYDAPPSPPPSPPPPPPPPPADPVAPRVVPLAQAVSPPIAAEAEIVRAQSRAISRVDQESDKAALLLLGLGG